MAGILLEGWEREGGGTGAWGDADVASGWWWVVALGCPGKRLAGG